jgi:archaellum component FlaG (FlaF/FlaG flagellin family)
VQGGLFGRKKEEEKKYDAKDSVALGIDMMKEAANDPNAMKEAMEMMNDPETKKVHENEMKYECIIYVLVNMRKDVAKLL